MVATVRTETPTQALSRLAEKARDEGVKIQHNPATGQYFASSVSTPGHRHTLTATGCDCQGFARHGRCKHYAALMAALGFLPVPAPAICHYCEGAGEVPSLYGGMYANSTPMEACKLCGGTGWQGGKAVA